MWQLVVCSTVIMSDVTPVIRADVTTGGVFYCHYVRCDTWQCLLQLLGPMWHLVTFCTIVRAAATHGGVFNSCSGRCDTWWCLHVFFIILFVSCVYVCVCVCSCKYIIYACVCVCVCVCMPVRVSINAPAMWMQVKTHACVNVSKNAHISVFSPGSTRNGNNSAAVAALPVPLQHCRRPQKDPATKKTLPSCSEWPHHRHPERESLPPLPCCSA